MSVCNTLLGGNKKACFAMKRMGLDPAIYYMFDIKAEKDSHPNKLPFTGTLLLLDVTSDQPPNGAEGHRIYVPKGVAKKRLNTLVGMGLNYKDSLDGHAPRRKVGVIEKAWIEGNKVKVRGVVWKKDFPEAEKDLRGGRLGMSMELSDVYVKDRKDDVWILVDFHFSGATALYKKAAAYYQTALAAARLSLGKSGGRDMPTKAKKKRSVSATKKRSMSQGELLASAIAAGVAPAIEAAMEKSLTPLIKVVRTQSRNVAALQSSVLELLKAQEDKEDEEEMEAQEETEVLDEEDEDMGAEGEDDEEDYEKDMESEGDDEEEEVEAEGEEDDDEEEVEAGMEDLEEDHAEEEPGQLNKDTENQGDKKTVTAGRRSRRRRGFRASRSKRRRVGSITAASERIGDLEATVTKTRRLLKKSNFRVKKLGNQVESLQAQADHYAEVTERRTLTPEVATLMAKSGHDVSELLASGQKLSVLDVDEMFNATGVDLDVTSRMAIKNQLLERGLMEDGAIQRIQ